MPERLAVGIDVGGTKIAGGVVDEDGRILARTRRATPSTDPAAVLDAITEIVEEFRGRHPVRAVGIGAAGYVDAPAPRCCSRRTWRGGTSRCATRSRGAPGCPVLVDNDANAAGWAEWRFGAARGYADVVLVTLGTGIGGAHGPRRQAVPRAARHGGRVRPHAGGRPTACRASAATGAAGSSTRAGGSSSAAPGRRRRRAPTSGGPSCSWRLAGDLVDGSPWGPVVRGPRGGPGAGRRRRPLARHRPGEPRGVARPRRSSSSAGESAARRRAPARPARAAFAAHLTGRGYRSEARIVAAHLGNDAGLVGAADLARLRARRRRPASPGYSVRGPAVARSGRRRRRRPR